MQPTGPFRAAYRCHAIDQSKQIQEFQTFLRSVIKKLEQENSLIELVCVLQAILRSPSLTPENLNDVLAEVRGLLFTLHPDKLEPIREIAENTQFKEISTFLKQPQPFLSFFLTEELTPSFLLHQIALKNTNIFQQKDFEPHLSNEHLIKILELLEAKKIEGPIVTSFPLTPDEQSLVLNLFGSFSKSLEPAFLLYRLSSRNNVVFTQKNFEEYLTNAHLQKILNLLKAKTAENAGEITFLLTSEEESMVLTELICFFLSINEREKALHLVSQAPEDIQKNLFPRFEESFSS